MAEEMILDFSGAPPSDGGGVSDHIPPGTYVVRCDTAELGTSKKGNAMITARFLVSRGPYQNKRLTDWFSLPSEANQGQTGLSRLNSLLVASRGKEAKGRNKLDSVLGAIIGQECLADVDDQQLAAQAGYDAPLTVSNIVAYHFPKSEKGQARIKAMQAAASGAAPPTPAAAPPPPPPPPPAAPAVAPVAVAPVAPVEAAPVAPVAPVAAPLDDGLENLEAAPVAAAPVAVAPAEAPVAEPPTADDTALEDLFND